MNRFKDEKKIRMTDRKKERKVDEWKDDERKVEWKRTKWDG